ncbi:lysozyme inhibitor LprI family protein [Acuticoccus mangrovi]|uniref:DUF1311 domain-containing protein n=1 Tax=Acuticoccus mangrovi TaxID=2796142 RepID=A0A934MHQ1_9HYPH|nr:lysozyme inhibitor LprI family protein [Acuticoccus mangrovi]MBJ3777913.1 DUF1311 domain-containing protein [Acuticoccus mangrovi]
MSDGTMHHLLRAAAVALCVGFATAAAAEGCGDDATQADLNECAAKAYEAADDARDAKYQAILARLASDSDAAALLRAAEEAWVAYRDAECTFATSAVSGGSIYPLVWAECLTGLTKARTETLDAYLSCEEGDTACPVPPQ